jgi:hypothetical protein
MRSAAELAFRIRQETSNLWMYAFPAGRPSRGAGKPCFPDPAPLLPILRQTAYAEEISRLAEAILSHRFPLLGYTVETGPHIDWRRDYVHGISTPPVYFRRLPYLDFRRVGDHKVIWELNRHQHLVVLAQAFLLQERAEYLAELEAQMKSWMEQNPLGGGINWTSALEVAFRALSWIWIDHFAGSHWTADFRDTVLSQIWLHGRYLEANLSVYFSPNTHLLGEAVALHAIGRRLEGAARTSRWRALGDRIVREEMNRQVEADGSHFERSSYYHIYALDFFLLHAALAGADAPFLEKLGRMADFLAALMDESGAIPLIGDDDGGRLLHPYGPRQEFGRATLAAASVLLGRGDWPYGPADLHPLAVWLFGARACQAPPPRPAAPSSRLFPDCGLAVLRAGAVQVVADAGPFGPGGAGHSHSDTLSLHVRAGDREILTDPGTYTYVSDPVWRDRFRGSAAHNTVRVDGRDQASPAGPFRWRDKPSVNIGQWSSAPDVDFLDATCLSGAPAAPVKHRRRIVLCKPDVLLVVDDVDGPPGDHLVEQFWHPGAAVERLPNAFRIGGLCLLFPGDIPIEVEEGAECGWRSDVLGARAPATVLCRRARTPLPVRWATILLFSDSPEAVTAREASGALQFHFDGRGWTVELPPSGLPTIRRG